jgi:hypothetical protein
LTTVNVIRIDRSAPLEDPLAGDRGDGNRKPPCRLADLLAERAAEPTAVKSDKHGSHEHTMWRPLLRWPSRRTCRRRNNGDHP